VRAVSPGRRSPKILSPGASSAEALARVLTRCEFFRHAASGVPLTYTEWVLLASQLACFDGGQQVFHQLSALDPARYLPAEADAKFIEVVRSFSSPARCETIARASWRCPILGGDGRCREWTTSRGGCRAPAATGVARPSSESRHPNKIRRF
jgi:hypothetical protein